MFQFQIIIQVQILEIMNDYAGCFARDSQIQQKEGKNQRNGDWICIKCNNLNFSFRKKCNRCRQQSKQQNDNNLISAYQIYYQYYQQDVLQIIDQPILKSILQQNTDALQGKRLLSPNPRLKKLKIMDKQLPSVSPLLKRYNSSKTSKRIGALAQNSFYNSNQWQNQWLSSYESEQNQAYIQCRQEKNDDLERILQNIFI